MKTLAKIFWDSVNDRRVWALSFVVFAAVAISTPVPITAAPTAYDLSLSTSYSPETCRTLGLGSGETSSKAKLACATGSVPSTLAALTRSISGADFNEINEVLVALRNDPYNPENVAALEELSQRSGGSLLGATKNLTYAMIDQRPASGIIYTDEVLAKVIFPDAVYAQTQGGNENPTLNQGEESETPTTNNNSQDIPAYFPGTGFQLLSPIRTIWSYLLWISYSFMIILVVIVALALMFRAKLSGDQAVQLQTAIPGIVMAMILIPLSYPISGLFIDGITLGSNAVHGFFFGPAGAFNQIYEGDGSGNGLKNDLLGESDTNRGLYIDDPRLNIFRFQGLIRFENVKSSIEAGICGVVAQDSSGATSNVDCEGLWGTAGNYKLVEFILSGITNVVWQLVALVLHFILSFFSFFVAFRIGWRLFKQFITMMVLPVISPLIFATLAIPGRGNELVIWYLKKMGNVTANFVAAYAMLLLAAVFAAPTFITMIPDNAVGTLTDYQPPLIGSIFGSVINTTGDAVAVGTGNSGVVAILFYMIGFGIYVVTPGILQQITDALAPKTENPFIKLFQQELGASSQFAFRQAPAVASSLASNVYNRGIQPIGQRIGNYRANRFEDSRGEQFVEKRRQAIIDARQKAADSSRGWVSRGMNAVRAGALQAEGRARSQMLGQGDALNPQKGDNPASIQLSIEGLDAYGFSGQGGPGTQFRVKASTLGTTTDFAAKLVVAAPDGASSPQGFISYKNTGSSGVLTIINNSSTPGASGQILLDPSLSVSSVATNVEKITGPASKNVYFGGQNKVKIPIILRLPAPIPQKVGAWSHKPIEITVGDGNSSPLAKLAVTFSIES